MEGEGFDALVFDGESGGAVEFAGFEGFFVCHVVVAVEEFAFGFDDALGFEF